MRDHEQARPYRQSKSIEGLFKSHGVHALLLAVALGFVDVVVISGIQPTDQISEWVLPLRSAVMLTIGTVALTIGAVSSFLGSLWRDRMTRAGGEQGRGQLAAGETAIPGARSKAA